MSPSPPECVRLDVPWLTILKVLSAAVLVWIWLQLWPIVMVMLVSLVLAVTLEPIVHWLERRKFSRGLSVVVVGAVPLAALGAFLSFQPWRRSRNRRRCSSAVSPRSRSVSRCACLWRSLAWCGKAPKIQRR
jgi:hypothetical protein